jgi:hypothetical protein
MEACLTKPEPKPLEWLLIELLRRIEPSRDEWAKALEAAAKREGVDEGRILGLRELIREVLPG